MSASESEPPSGTAPLTELGRVLKDLLRREAAIDRREIEGGDRQDSGTELWRQTNLEAIDGIELAIASIAATELAEAAVQILIAAGYANHVADELEEPRLREPAVRLARLLRSALPVIASSAGIDLEAYGAGRYAQGARDWPFSPGDSDEGSGERPPSAPAEPQEPRREREAPTSRDRPRPLSLVEPRLKDDDAETAREEAGQDPGEPSESPQNAIVMPILDLLFAEAGLTTKRRVEED
jgi:hypothetical protein